MSNSSNVIILGIHPGSCLGLALATMGNSIVVLSNRNESVDIDDWPGIDITPEPAECHAFYTTRNKSDRKRNRKNRWS